MTGTNASNYPAVRATRPLAPRPGPALTEKDRALLAKHGRTGLIRQLRMRARVALGAFLATATVGMTYLAVSPIEDDTGLWITMAATPTLVALAHVQARLNRVRLNDPDRPVSISARGAGRLPAAEQPDELDDLAVVRDRLLATLPALDASFPTVAAEIRLADKEAHPSLEQLGEALAALSGLPVDADPETASAREEIRERLEAGIAQYQQLLAQSVLLLVRSEASPDDAPLVRARELIATHNEGLRAADGLPGW